MTEITEVKTGAAPATDFICPLMSGQLAPSKPGPGDIAPPGVMILKPTIVVCVREKCQWWSDTDGCCILESATGAVDDLNNSIASLRSVVSGSILSIKDVLEPPTESPLVRIADNLEEIRKTLDDSECLSPRPRPPRPFRGYRRD